MPSATLHVRLYASNRVDYRVLPLAANDNPGVISANARVTQSEGYAEATLVLAGTKRNYPGLIRRRGIAYYAVWQSAIDGSRRMDIMYRGKIKRITPSKSVQGQKTIEVKIFGLWSDAAKVQCWKRYANTAQEDKCVFFGDLARTYIATQYAADGTNDSPGLIVQSLPIGDIPLTVDGYDKTFGDAVSALTQNTGQVATGADVDPLTQQERVFFRPFDDLTQPARHTLVLPSIQGGRQSPESDNTGQATVLTIRGGAVVANAKNLIGDSVQGNPSFESPQLPGEGPAGNYLLNYSFEQGGNTTADHWALENGAVPKNKENKSVTPNSGNRYVELSDVNELARQYVATPAIPLVAGRTYAIDVRARLQNSIAPAAGRLTLRWYSDHTQTTLVLEKRYDVTPTGINWDLFGGLPTCPAGAVSLEVEVKCTSIGGAGEAYSLLIDDVRFYDPSQTTQLGWQFTNFGSAQANAIRWDDDTRAWHGSRSVYLDVAASDEDGQDAHLEPFLDGRFTATGGQEIIGGFAVYPLDSMLVFVEIHEWQSNGTSVGVATRTAYTLVPNQWQIIPATRALAGDTQSQAQVYLTFRSNGRLWVDAAFCYDSNSPFAKLDPADRVNHPELYIEANQYRGTFRADTLFPTGPIHDEAVEVGDIPVTEDRPEITSDSEGQQYATAYFQRFTLPLQRPSVESFGIIETNRNGGSTATMMPGESIRAVGADADEFLPNPLCLVEKVIDFNNGLLTVTPYLSAEPRDPARTIAKILAAQRLAGLVSSSASGSYSSNVGGTGGGSGTPVGDAGGDLEGSFPDPTVGKIQGVPVAATVPSDGQALVYNETSGQWEPGTVGATVPDATNTTAGKVKLSVAPVGDSIAVGDNDPRVSTFVGSGTGHRAGLVPDPGATAGTTRYMREDGSWAEPTPGGGTTGQAIFGEFPTGAIDGSNVDYEFANLIASIAVFHDGVCLSPNAFTFAGKIVTLNTAISSGELWGNYAVGASSSGDADFDAYLARVTTAGGTLTTTESDAVLALITGLKADGIYPLLRTFWLGVGDYPASKVLLKYASGDPSSATYSGGITSSDWHQTGSTAGIQGDGIGKYINLGTDIPSCNATSISFGVGVTVDSTATAVRGTIGSSYDPASGNRCYILGTGSAASGQPAIGGLYGGLTGAGLTGAGMMSLCYDGNTAYAYKDTTNTASQNGTNTPWQQSGEFNVLRVYNNYSDARVYWAYVSEYLASADIANLKGRMDTFKSAIGQV